MGYWLIPSCPPINHGRKSTKSTIVACPYPCGNWSDVRKLHDYYSQGLLGGEKMPEDANPDLLPSSKENFHYFTLPMALNYQRNSYKLWEAALLTYNDPTTQFVFDPCKVFLVEEDILRTALVKLHLSNIKLHYNLSIVVVE